MPVEAKTTFSRFIDLLLARLYDLQQAHPGEFINLDEVAAELVEKVPENWVFEAAKVLKSRGLIDAIFTFGGVHAQMSGSGMLFVEQESTPVIREYHANPEHFVQHVNVSGANAQVIVGRDQSGLSQTSTIEREREWAFRLVDEMRNKLEADPSLDNRERDELKADLDSIKSQLSRRSPNRPALAALLEPLSHVTSIASHVATLIARLNQ
jgi:hypothetical protein